MTRPTLPLPAVPQAGDFGLVPTYGDWKGRLIGWAIRYGTDSPVNHAFIYVGGGMIVEAQPGGARLVKLRYNPEHIVWSTGRLPLPGVAANEVVNQARGIAARKVGYGWLDIVAIALAQRRTFGLVHADWPLEKQPWWVKRIERLDKLICSQLVDVCWEAAGVQLFKDGRIPGLVSPGDLWRLLGSPVVAGAR